MKRQSAKAQEKGISFYGIVVEIDVHVSFSESVAPAMTGWEHVRFGAFPDAPCSMPNDSLFGDKNQAGTWSGSSFQNQPKRYATRFFFKSLINLVSL
jgi:hypothetical protein